jgi:hypothetical protein
VKYEKEGKTVVRIKFTIRDKQIYNLKKDYSKKAYLDLWNIVCVRYARLSKNEQQKIENDYLEWASNREANIKNTSILHKKYEVKPFFTFLRTLLLTPYEKKKFLLDSSKLKHTSHFSYNSLNKQKVYSSIVKSF